MPGIRHGSPHYASFMAAAARERAQRKRQSLEIATGGGSPGLISPTPAAYLPAERHVPEHDYVVCDDVDGLVQRAREGLVCAGRCGAHRTSLFEDVVLLVLVSACTESVQKAESCLKGGGE